MPCPTGRAIFQAQALEVVVMGGVESDRDQLIRKDNRGDLAIGKSRRLARSGQPGPFRRVPGSRPLIIGQVGD